MAPRTLVRRIAAGLSDAPGTAHAAAEAAASARDGLDGAEADLAFLFLSASHLEQAAEAAATVREELEPRHLVGCVAEGVVGGARELEEGPAEAVWAAALPGAEIEPFHAAAVPIEGGAAVTGFPALDDPSLVTLLVDPFSFPVAEFVERLNESRPGLPLVGGIASGAGRPGAQALVVDDDVHESGAVGAVVSGVPVVTAVSQGCMPIGTDSVITSAEGNVVHELAGKPALERLKAELAALPPHEQQLAADGLLVGLVIDENKAEYERGDFLIRGLLGADEESGAIAVGAPVRVGQTLRFHVRHARSADEDLRETLGLALRGARPAGALLFTCNGRGTRMFPEPDHDARAVSEALGGPAVAGFFCGGEIGPVAGRAFLHGFTATMALFLEN